MKQFYRTLFFIILLITGLVPATIFAQDSYTVTSLGDKGAWDDPDTEEIDESSDGVCDDGTGKCTLRAALEEASNRDHSVIINFGISGTIVTSGILPHLADGSKILGSNRNITIFSSTDALSGGDNITITNLVFRVSAVAIESGSNCTITGNQILSGQVGISVVDANIIGGISEDNRNVIGGCILGIALGGSDNRVLGNYIGVDISGNTALANTVGIVVANSGNIIGGSTLAERNIISGNVSQGIGAAGTNNTIKGNYIGIGADGVTGIPNGIGVKMDGAGVIGGDTPGERNIISSNGIGVSLGVDPDGNSAVILKGNYIGTDISGTFPKGNSGAGVTITSTGHRIEKNVISANGTTGIGVLSVVGASLSTDNVITGNKIGTDASGLNPLPNAVGIIFQGPSNNNIVGEGLLATYEGNTIAFNNGPGIFVDAQQAFGGIPKGNTFRKNLIFKNGDLGIKIQPLAQEGILSPVIDSLKKDILYGHGAIASARIDVYESDPDPSGAGEGKTWLATGSSKSDGTFEIPVTNPNCIQLTITQTDLNRNTSQFSQNLNLDPVVKSLVPNCQQTFLVGVSLINPFTATMDWKGVPEADRHVTFTLNGEVHQGNLSGNIATTTFNMGSIAPGTNTMRIKATSCGGASPDFTYEVCGTTVPEWAAPAGSIIATGASCDVNYKKVIKFPDPAIVPNMPLISNIPFIGGALGFLSTQGQVSLKASSAGGTLTNEDVGLNSKFNLAGESFNLTTSGTTNTTLLCGSLNLDGSLTAAVSVSHTYSWGTDLSSLLPATCPSIPLLGEICESARAVSGLASLGAEVGGSIGITANYTAGSSVKFTGGSGTGSIFIRPFINVFPFSAQGRGSLTVQVDVPSFDTHGQVSLGFTVSAGPFGSRNFGPYTWPGKGSANFFAEGIKYPSLNPSLKINNPNSTTPDNIKGQDTLIVSGIPSDGAPALAAGPNGKRVIVWSHFSATGARPSGDIGIKIFNGATWGPIKFLNADIQVDQKPVAAFDNSGHIIVCWERNLTTTIPADTAIWVASYLQGFNIQYSILDANNGTVQNTGTFGNVNTYDFSPRLSGGIDGSVLLIWESTSGNTIYGNASDPASLHSVRWNGSSWGAAAVISSTLTGVHSWESANRSNDTSLVAMVLDTDGNFSTSGDWEIYASLWNGTVWTSLVRLTNDALVDWGVHCTYTGDGRSAIAWLKNSKVVGVLGNVTQQPVLWLDESNKVGLEFMNGKLAEGGGKLVLAWPEVGNISYSNADLSQPTWSQRFSRSIEGDERSLSLAVDKNGQGIVGYLHVPYRGNGNTLSDTADIFITQVEIGSVITDVKDETPGIQDKYSVLDVYPNPFNSATKIRFHLTQNSMVILKIFDIHGQEVATLVHEKRQAGYYEEDFNATDLSGGTYFYRLQTGKIVETKKMIIFR
jgi:hypothetical protein